MTPHSERTRQWVHIGSGSFSLLLRLLTWWEAASFAALALAFNLLLLPRVGGRRLYRPVDHTRGFPLGIVLYPLSVLLLILFFPTRLDIVAAAWAILALGDGAATLVGRTTTTNAKAAKFAVIRGPLPWNHDKTVAGTTAFIVWGATGGVALALWTRPVVTPLPSIFFAVVAPIVAALAAALVETIPVRLDDNISVPATAAFVLWLASEMTAESVGASRPALVAATAWAIGVNAIVAWLGHRARTVSLSGAIGGALIGAIIFASAGGAAWIVLFLTFAAASIASRFGLQRKALLGIEEDRGGRYRNVMTGELLAVEEGAGAPGIPMMKVLASFPVALLSRE